MKDEKEQTDIKVGKSEGKDIEPLSIKDWE